LKQRGVLCESMAVLQAAARAMELDHSHEGVGWFAGSTVSCIRP
jgi:hypothetical protein